MKRFFSFEEMITPTVITIVYWIGIALIVLGGIGSIIGTPGGGAGQALIILIGIVVGVVFWRIWCELILVVFKIYEKLTLIANAKQGQG